MNAPDLSTAWLALLHDILKFGNSVSPRGKRTLELPQRTVCVDMNYPVLGVAERKLSYQFMAAEAYWILSGDASVAGIAPWNKNVAQFSDDGEQFSGAYGPMVVSQLPYVVQKLNDDPDTRQAGLTIWKPNPPASKDIPCTVAVWFQLREGRLNTHVFMRSSDAWLGLPYDIFSFSMLSVQVLGYLNASRLEPGDQHYSLGDIYLTAASSHLYETNWVEAEAMLDKEPQVQKPVPVDLCREQTSLLMYLRQLRNTKPGDQLRWWE